MVTSTPEGAVSAWTLDGRPVAADEVGELLRGRIAAGALETWFASASGRSLAVVSNGERAMVLLLEHEGDPGEHAVDPDVDPDGWSDGYELANGQSDEYPDADTVPLAEALRIVEHVVAGGSWPADARWVVDR
ncbi:hypothetical protein Amir_1915 [Actinosynnema mirum DSM 43827]|uniref:Immunity protein Imm1 n=1 Tax=Actinosynnema mirum (strain ATCC 29888 / DSM 43827 / JCM 3225 / NBRC 14064 / NCIMB 13271 / NRRL B-12336 / IMRU 3971 / 101) TaxID=446462 RepID=C6WEC0_ACTMD|nr:hypothetical protein Amir_1915 [Actinosynnema mirum DSM 43827]